MTEITIEELLKAGAHYGHQTHRWNPKMKNYILTTRNGLHILDPQKTFDCFKNAVEVVKEVAKNNGIILFVGTKKQAQSIIEEEAKRCGMFYVAKRWLGGMLTNFQTIRQSINKLNELERMKSDGTYEKLTKKEVMKLEKKREKLETVLSGIRNMERLPDLTIIVDVKLESTAVAESRRLGIPIVGLCDTNGDPDLVDYLVPANDDSMRSIKIFISAFADAIIESRGGTIPETIIKEKEGTQEAEDVQGEGVKEERAKNSEEEKDEHKG
ncbi:MAG: 30S ribosomal protein S2 [bacterium]